MTNQVFQFWTSIACTLLITLILGACSENRAPVSHDGGPNAPAEVATDGGTSEIAVLCADFCVADPRSLDDCSDESMGSCRAACVARLAAAPDPNDLCLECLLEDAYFGGQRIAIPSCDPNPECRRQLCSYRGCTYCELDYAAEAACREATRETVECDLELGSISNCAEICG